METEKQSGSGKTMDKPRLDSIEKKAELSQDEQTLELVAKIREMSDEMYVLVTDTANMVALNRRLLGENKNLKEQLKLFKAMI